MRKKIKIRALLLVVISIWGYNLYKAYLNYRSEDILEEQNEYAYNSFFAPQSFNKDTFKLHLPERDPFLDGRSKKEHTEKPVQKINPNKSNNNRRQTKVNPVQTEVVAKWPNIKYLGFVKSHDKNNALCLLQINGSLQRLAEGDNGMGVYVSKAYRDSVSVTFSGERKVIKKG